MKSSILNCKTFRKTLCYTAIIIGVLWFLVFNFGIEGSNLRLGDSFATTADNRIADSSQNTINTTVNSINQVKSGDLLLSNPFYTSQNSVVLNKLNLHSVADSATTKELLIFYELGAIDKSETVHNIGYYIEESRFRATLNESIVANQNTDSSSIDNHIKFAKGTGFYVTTDADIIGWNAYDQVFNYSPEVTKYLGIIYFSTNEIPGGKLADLNNKVGVYEYDLYSNGSAIRNIWLWPTNTPTTTTQAAINTNNSTISTSSLFPAPLIS